MVIKKIFSFDKEAPIVQERERNNYMKIRHPFIPKFYGTIENTNMPIFAFIEGQTLLKIKYLHLSRKEKMTIIFQLLSVMKYLHDNNFVYRDLKPSNIMIDQNKNLVLIDFDRMLREDNNGDHTRDLMGDFVAPEIFSGILTKKSDIFSIGNIMNFIFSEEVSSIIEKQKIMTEYPNIDEIIEYIHKNDDEIMESILNNDDEIMEYILKNDYENVEYILKNEDKFAEKIAEYTLKKNKKITELIYKNDEQNILWPNSEFDFFETNSLKEIINAYIRENPNERPCIKDLIFDLGLFVIDADIFLDRIDADNHYILGLIEQNKEKYDIYQIFRACF